MIGDSASPFGSKPIDLSKLPLADLLSWLEMNPPAVPWSSLTNVPFRGVPFVSLEQYTVPSPGPVTGFAASLGPRLAAANYAHLLMLITAKSPGAGGSLTLQFNTDTSPTGTNYSYGWAGSASQAFISGQAQILLPDAVGASTDAFRGGTLVLVPNFLESGMAKTAFGVSVGSGGIFIFSGGWSGTAPITQFNCSFANNIAAGSTFSAYALGAQ